MAGPCCSVLLREATTPQIEERLRILLQGLAERIEGEDFWFWGRPFLATTKEDYPRALEELAEAGLPELLGWAPATMVTLTAMCNDRLDHRVLADLCLRIAREFGGIIDFGGSIAAGPKLDSPTSTLVVDDPDGLRGRLFATTWIGGADQCFTAHFGDTTLLESWLNDARFRMVK